MTVTITDRPGIETVPSERDSAPTTAIPVTADDETWIREGTERLGRRRERAAQADERFVRDGIRSRAARLAAAAARQELWLASARRRNAG